jgi:hypothetical protein
MKNFLKQITSLFATIFDVPHGTRLEEYIAWKRPQNHSDLERIVREFNELRYW